LSDSDFLDFVNTFDIFFVCETWQKDIIDYNINGYDCVSIPRPESVQKSSYRGHGGVCLFYSTFISKGVKIVETDTSGIIWIKLCKHYFNADDDIFICFSYIPPQNSHYYILHPIGFFETIEVGIRKYSDLGKVLWMGDLNARCGTRQDIMTNNDDSNMYLNVIEFDHNARDSRLPLRQSMDRLTNASGNKLIDLCLSSELCILNGRFGDSGQYTFMSTIGSSMIDYALCSIDFFPNIHAFNVHDMFSFSSHVPISVKLKISHNIDEENISEKININKIVWDNNNNDQYINSIQRNMVNIEAIVNSIIGNEVDLNTGVERLSNILYDTSFSLNGSAKVIHSKSKPKISRKLKSPWYDENCETARKEFRHANKAYSRHRTAENQEILLTKRRLFRIAKRRAKFKYNNAQKTKLNDLAKNKPQQFWKEIKKFRKNNKAGKVSKEDFYNHFKGLFSDSDLFQNDDVESNVNNDEYLNSNHDDFLDREFTVDEVLKAISTLKNGKSGSVDSLIPEMFKVCKNELAPVLCILFNYIFNNNLYPEIWMKGIIVPVPKKGDLNEVNNYRGVTLTSIFAKIFSIMIDIRLRKWADNNNILNNTQFGFVKGRSTVDCIFVLTSVINKVLRHENRKLYSSFIDFKKCFDYVYRNGIWFKLIQQGVSSKIVKTLQSMYDKVKSCVRVNGSLTEFFDSYMGVKQGEPLSPLLFIFFINDMYTYLQTDSEEYFSIDELQIYLLLFADDTVLFSYSKAGLQILLNKLYRYCHNWGITVNTDKTVCMVFKKGNRVENFEMFYNVTKLKVVETFTYLGLTLSSNGNFYKAQKNLSNQALKALYSLNSLFDYMPLDISDRLKLFDSLVSPILNYSSEVWGFHLAGDVENIHLKFLKRNLRVHSKTCNAAVYGEFARFPLIVIRKIRIIKYWCRILKSPNTLMFKLMYMTDNNGKFVNTWSKNVINLLSNLGYGYLWFTQNVSNATLNSLVQRIKDQYIQQWNSDIFEFSRLETYRIFKTTFECEQYLSCINNIKFLSALARFRCSAHRLAIEEGRYKKQERNLRICNKCNMNVVENEYHFLLTCPFYRDLRIKYIPHFYRTWPTIFKFKRLMNTTSNKELHNLATYLHHAFVKRSTRL